jgi:hypothetical protein
MSIFARGTAIGGFPRLNLRGEGGGGELVLARFFYRVGVVLREPKAHAAVE